MPRAESQFRRLPVPVHSGVMLLTAAPGLVYVVGIPAGLLLGAAALGVVLWMLIGRISRG
jgi:hypothetical protein